jgi:hypothetical protein
LRHDLFGSLSSHPVQPFLEVSDVKLNAQQANAITSAIWLVGIGILIVTGWWWPGIMFLIGVGSIVQGLVAGRGWYALQGGLWTIGIGVWALTSYSILTLFILIALSGLFSAFCKPPFMGTKPAPDPSLDDGF